MLLLAIGYVIFARSLDLTNWPLHFDAFRDLAGMQNLLAGYWWRDPALLDYPPWYPPLFVWLHGSLAKLLDIEPHLITSSSRYWINVWIPLAMYALLRTSVSRTAAFAGPIILVATSPWWCGTLSVAMPSVQGAAWVLLGLRAWHLARDKDGWQFAPAIIVALAAWTHPIATLLLGATLTFDIVRTLIQQPRREWRAPLRQFATTAVLSLLLASPVVLNLLLLPRVNHVPYEYFAHKLTMPKYALQFHVLTAPLLGLAGLVFIAIRRPALRWLLGYFLVGLIGQLAAYWGKAIGNSHLILVPHQFQWHTQMALTLALVVFLDGLIPALGTTRRRPLGIVLLVGLVLALVWSLRDQPLLVQAFTDADRYRRKRHATIDWIKANTDIDDVFVSDQAAAYYTISGFTGRKCLYTHPAHMNPACDLDARLAAQELIASATDPEQVRPLVKRYSIDYILLTKIDAQDGCYPILQQAGFAEEVFYDPNKDWRIYRIMSANSP